MFTPAIEYSESVRLMQQTFSSTASGFAPTWLYHTGPDLLLSKQFLSLAYLLSKYDV